MSLSTSPKDLFLESLDRCEDSPEFMGYFYDHFLDASEEIARKFRFTNFTKQHQMLKKSLRLVARATAGDPEGLQELAELARSHDRRHHDIRPEMYGAWLKAAIASAARHDPRWDDDIDRAWRSTLQHAIDYMTRRY